MTLKAKINGEWLKIPFYYIGDAIHTRFSSAKYTASNVHDALDEVADKVDSLEERIAKYAAIFAAYSAYKITRGHWCACSVVNEANIEDAYMEYYASAFTTEARVLFLPEEDFTAALPINNNFDYEDIVFEAGKAYYWKDLTEENEPFYPTVYDSPAEMEEILKEVEIE